MVPQKWLKWQKSDKNQKGQQSKKSLPTASRQYCKMLIVVHIPYGGKEYFVYHIIFILSCQELNY